MRLPIGVATGHGFEGGEIAWELDDGSRMVLKRGGFRKTGGKPASQIDYQALRAKAEKQRGGEVKSPEYGEGPI